MKDKKVKPEEELKGYEADFDELGRREAEEIDREELEQKKEEARKRLRLRRGIWRPRVGEERAVLVEGRVEKDTEFGSTTFFELEDLDSGQKLSLIGHGSLLKHLEDHKSYLLVYQGKVNGDSGQSFHRWQWEELK